MWEFILSDRWRRRYVAGVIGFCVLFSFVGGERNGRLVIGGSRQFTPGTSGVGEVLRVDGDEYEALVRNVSGGSAVNGNGSDIGRAGMPEHVGSIIDNVTVGTTDESTSSTSASVNPVVIAVNPEDSSRGTQQGDRFVPSIDRRKVVKPTDGGGGSDLSFTGILNGLLDSFINDPQPQSTPNKPSRPSPPQPPQPPSPPTTQSPSQESSQQDEELEEDEEEEDPPSPPSKSSTLEDQSIEEVQENASEEPLEDDEDTLDDYIPQKNSTSPQQQSKTCQGECRNIIFGLFLCDEIDNDAFCPESGLACCVNNPEPEFNRYKPYGNTSSEEQVHLDNDHDMEKTPVATQDSNEDLLEELEDDEEEAVPSSEKPVSTPPQSPPLRYSYGSRPPPPPPHYSNQSPPPQYYYPPPPPQTVKNPPHMMHAPPRMPLPCPRYCVKNYHDGYCSERLPSQFACGMDAFCCSHPVNSVKDEKQQQNDQNEDEEVDDLYRNEGLNEDAEVEEQNSSVKKIIGPCTEDVGSCVSTNIINIICFAHATPTDLYTCPRSSMKCCARKTALPKDSIPTTTTTPQPQKLDNSITRNISSSYPKPLPPPGPPQILPQFIPPPPPPQFQYNQFHQPQPVTNAPTSPLLAETPPPPIQTSQFTNQFGSGGVVPVQSRVPSRQPIGQYVCGVRGMPSSTTTGMKKRRRKKRVVGGQESLENSWCWMVALINSANQYLCGGALIGTQWVLTAAHCVTNIVRSGDAIYVRVGDHDLTSRYGSPGAATFRVATTYIHHNHNSQTLDNDIALLKLQGNAPLNEGVCLICLPSRSHMSEIPGKMCTVTGYGYVSESGPIPLKIREADIPIVSDEECVRNVNAVTERLFSLPQSSFCAGGDASGNDACQGDGGGPLVCRSDDPMNPEGGFYELTGLVSWGFGCSRHKVPGVYVKVSSFIGWIHQIIRSN